MSGLRIEVARKGYDLKTADVLNKSFDSDYFLPKISKYKRVSAGASVQDLVLFPHGLGYAPQGLTYIEIDDNPLTVGFARGNYIADNTNVGATPGTVYDYTTSPYTSRDNKGIYGVVMLEPLGTPTSVNGMQKGEYPLIVAGNSRKEMDYEQKIHTYYDTLKVHSSGRLTITAPAIQYTDEDNHWYTATYNHNLGYIPMFSPFVPYSEDLNGFYQWTSQWYKGGAWGTGVTYGPNDTVTNGGKTYKCRKYHTSSSITEPGNGTNWATYWTELSVFGHWATSTPYKVGDRVYEGSSLFYCYADHTSSIDSRPESGANWQSYWWYDSEGSDIYDVINLNEHEQDRIVYGGVSVLQTQAIYFYATETQIVMKLLRRAYDIGGPMEASTFAKITITADYTVFENQLNRDLSLPVKFV